MNLNRGHSLPGNMTDIEFMRDGDIHKAYMNKFTSRATSLGAPTPPAEILRMALNWPGGVTCVSIEDACAMETSLALASTSDTGISDAQV